MRELSVSWRKNGRRLQTRLSVVLQHALISVVNMARSCRSVVHEGEAVECGPCLAAVVWLPLSDIGEGPDDAAGGRCVCRFPSEVVQVKVPHNVASNRFQF
jgi:hypothetical protein